METVPTLPQTPCATTACSALVSRPATPSMIARVGYPQPAPTCAPMPWAPASHASLTGTATTASIAMGRKRAMLRDSASQAPRRAVQVPRPSALRRWTSALGACLRVTVAMGWHALTMSAREAHAPRRQTMPTALRARSATRRPDARALWPCGHAARTRQPRRRRAPPRAMPIARRILPPVVAMGRKGAGSSLALAHLRRQALLPRPLQPHLARWVGAAADSVTDAAMDTLGQEAIKVATSPAFRSQNPMHSQITNCFVFTHQPSLPTKITCSL